MERRNYRGLKRYESLLQTVCRTDDYYKLPEKEWEGCLGVACAIAVIEGVAPNMFALSKHLDIPHYNTNLQHAFERLRINGVFSVKFDISKDKSLTGCGTDGKFTSSSEVERNAWCNIAGIAGSFLGMKEKK